MDGFAGGKTGAEEDRTPNLGIANAALSQLSYRPDRGAARGRFPQENRSYDSVSGLSSDCPERRYNAAV